MCISAATDEKATVLGRDAFPIVGVQKRCKVAIDDFARFEAKERLRCRRDVGARSVGSRAHDHVCGMFGEQTIARFAFAHCLRRGVACGDRSRFSASVFRYVFGMNEEYERFADVITDQRAVLTHPDRGAVAAAQPRLRIDCRRDTAAEPLERLGQRGEVVGMYDVAKIASLQGGRVVSGYGAIGRVRQHVATVGRGPRAR